MRRISTNPFRFALPGMALAVAMAAGLAWAQDPPATQQPAPAWRHMGDPAQAKDPEPVDRATAPPAYGLPPQLTLKAGTYVNIRVSQALSNDRSKAGDTFSASLLQPVIVDGVVVAARGQMVYGRVTESEKAHKGNDSRLGLELTSLTLADGAQAPIHSQLVAKPGSQASGGPEAATVVSAPAAGAPAVLTAHSHGSVVYPGTALTFGITSPVAIDTANASQAFRYAGPEDYLQTSVTNAATRPPARRTTYVYGPGYYPYYYPYYGYPYYWGPSFGIGIGFGGRYGRWR